MVSKTDKTRPYLVAYNDPYNRRFRIIGNFGYPKEGRDEWTWKKLTSCHDSHCCGKDSPWRTKENTKRRHGWKRELRREVK